MSAKQPSAEKRCQAIEAGLVLIKSGLPPTKAWETVGKQFNVHKNVVYRWYGAVRGKPRQEWLDILTAKHKGRTVTAPFSEKAWDYFLDAYSKSSPPSMSEAYEKTLVESRLQNWSFPSVRTVQRRAKLSGISRRYMYDIHDDVWECFLKIYKAMSQPSFSLAYKETSEVAKKNGWQMPSYDAFRLLYNMKGFELRTIYDND
ncbi:MAG: DNA-binding domain-containing protein [Cycloclasticus sp.]